MSIVLAISLVIGAWSVLRVLGNERMRQIKQEEYNKLVREAEARRKAAAAPVPVVGSAMPDKTRRAA